MNPGLTITHSGIEDYIAYTEKFWRDFFLKVIIKIIM